MSKFYAFNSGGNDSIATLQYLVLEDLPAKAEVVSVYCNTGWAAPYWEERMVRVKGWCEQRGIRHVELNTLGFEQMVRIEGNARGDAPGRFPTGMQKFCTRKLKIFPSQRFLKEEDPEGHGVCVVGVRRAESERRKATPVFIPRSETHGWRSLWHPLAEHDDEARDWLVQEAGFEVLDHRSDECEPCIFSSRADLRRVTPEKVAVIRQLEKDADGLMFRPNAYAGARGIDEIMRWAWSERGQFKPKDPPPPPTVEDQLRALETSNQDDGEEVVQDCESDYCGL